MRSKVLVFAMAALMGMVGSAEATTTSSLCNVGDDADCGLGLRITRARELGEGEHYFWDFKNAALYHMRVTGSGGTVPLNAPAVDYVQLATSPELTVSSIAQPKVSVVTLTANEQQMLSAAMDVYNQNGKSTQIIHTFNVSLNIPASSASVAARSNQFLATATESGTRPMTAMDAVTTPALRDQTTQAAMGVDQTGPFWFLVTGLRTAVAALSSMVTLTYIPSPIPVLGRIEFPDGSYYMVKFDFSSRSYVYVKGASRDSQGNPIPETRDEITGEPGGTLNYVFPNTPKGAAAGDDMINHFQNLGATVSGEKVHVGYIVGCTSAAGGEVRCIIRPIRG